MSDPDSAYHRKKQPELVRRAILDHAESLVMSEGVAGLTIQAVAAAAGVTKGGVFHHYASKQALLEAMFADMVDRLDAEIDGHLQTDTARGCFTRAYIETLLVGPAFGVGSPFDALSAAVMTDPTLWQAWDGWFAARMERHAGTDAHPHLEIVRFACDGAWLSYFDRRPGAELQDLRDRLVAMTR